MYRTEGRVPEKSKERLRRGGKNTQKNCTKTLNDLENHDGVVTHLECTS